jgi:uncharacterized integral membrane protein
MISIFITIAAAVVITIIVITNMANQDSIESLDKTIGVWEIITLVAVLVPFIAGVVLYLYRSQQNELLKRQRAQDPIERK